MFSETDFGQFGSVLMAILVVLAALVVFAAVSYLIKTRLNIGALGQRFNNNTRLNLIETLPIDQRHKLVMFSKDGHEHLVLLGGNSELLIETTASAAQNRAQQQQKIPTPRNLPSSEDLDEFEAMILAAEQQKRTSDPAPQQNAIDVFDQARDRVFTQTRPDQNATSSQDQNHLRTNQPPRMRKRKQETFEDTDDFSAILRAQNTSPTSQQNIEASRSISGQNTNARSPQDEEHAERIRRLRQLLNKDKQ